MLDDLARAVMEGLEGEVVEGCRKALKEGMEPQEVLREGLCRGMHRAGELYEKHEYFLPELLLASEAMQAGMRAVAPALRLYGGAAEGGPVVVLGVVRGDVHEIGKNLVGVMLEAEGFRVVDLGIDVPPERFIEELQGRAARILALSTMMTTTLPAMRRTVELAREVEPRPLVVVGGAPLTSALAADLGADGYEETAARAPALIRALLSRSGLPSQDAEA